MLAGGVDVRSAAGILGHSTPSTTLGIYAHALAAVQAVTVTKIDERLTRPDAGQVPDGGAVFAVDGNRMATVALRPAKNPVHTGFQCSPNGIRTRVTAVRGRRPRPLDDRAVVAPGHGLEPR